MSAILAITAILLGVVIAFAAIGWLVFWFAARQIAREERRDNDEMWPWYDD